MTPEADKSRLKAGRHAVCYTCRLHDRHLSGDGPLRQEGGGTELAKGSPASSCGAAVVGRGEAQADAAETRLPDGAAHRGGARHP